MTARRARRTGRPIPRPIPRASLRVEVESLEEEKAGVVAESRMMLPVGMEIQEDGVSQHEEASGPQQNLISFVVLLKLAGHATNGIALTSGPCSRWMCQLAMFFFSLVGQGEAYG